MDAEVTILRDFWPYSLLKGAGRIPPSAGPLLSPSIIRKVQQVRPVSYPVRINTCVYCDVTSVCVGYRSCPLMANTWYDILAPWCTIVCSYDVVRVSDFSWDFLCVLVNRAKQSNGENARLKFARPHLLHSTRPAVYLKCASQECFSCREGKAASPALAQALQLVCNLRRILTVSCC